MKTNDLYSETSAQLSGEEIEFYSENGYLGPYTLCSPEKMAAIRDEVHPLVTERIAARKDKSHRAPETSTYKEEPVTVNDLHLRFPSLLELITHPNLIDRMAGLMGPDILLWRTMMWVKKPNSRIIYWHQDLHKKSGYGIISDISCWLAIEEVTIDNGCVQLLPGTHKKITESKKLRGRGFMDKAFHSSDLLVPEIFADIEPVKMVMKPGQFFFFSQLCFHGSAPNLSKKNRLGMALRFIPTSTSTKMKAPCVLVRGEDEFGHQNIISPPFDHSTGE